MYLKTPYENYRDICCAVKERRLLVRIVKNQSGAICSLSKKGKTGIMIGFVLQILIPAAGAIACGYDVQGWAARLPVLFHGILPFVFPLNSFAAVAMTMFGLYGLAAGWNAVLVAFLLPGICHLAGRTIWWFFIQLAFMKNIMTDRKQFEEFWRQGLFFLQDRNGVYQYKDV